MIATVKGIVSGIQSGDAVTAIEIVWLLTSALPLGTDAELQAAASAETTKKVTLTSPDDLTAYWNATTPGVAGAGYALSSSNLVTGNNYTPAVRVSESRSSGADAGPYTGAWVKGTAFLATAIAAPAAPFTLSVVGAPTQATLSIIAIAGGAATSYSLKRGTVSGTRVQVQTPASFPYTNTGLVNGTTYYFSVVATNAAGSVESAEYTVTPQVAAPTQPVASLTPSSAQVIVSLASGGVGATSYDIKWGTVAGTRSNTIPGVTLPYTHTGRTNSTAYYYSIVATNAGGSTESAEVNATPIAVAAPTTPVIGVAAGNAQNVISLTSGGANATSFNIKWGTVSGTRGTTITGVTLPYTHSGLTNSQAYFYSIVAVNGGGSTESTEGTGTPTASTGIIRATVGQLLYDNFDDNSLNAAWTAVAGGDLPDENGGKLNMTTKSSLAIRTKRAFASNVGIYACVDISLIVSSDSGLRLYVHNGDFNTHYQFTVANAAVSELVKRIAGADTTMQSTTAVVTDNSTRHYAIKVLAGVITVYRDGVLWFTGNDATLTTFSDIELLATGGGVTGRGGFADNVAVCKSASISCTGIPSGSKLRVGGSGGPVATSVGGTTAVDCTGLMFPQSVVEVLNSSNTVISTLTATNDVFGGDTYTYA